MKLSSIRTDAVKREQGDWVRDIPEMGDLELRVRGIGNSDFRKLQAEQFRSLPRAIRRAGKVDIATQDKHFAELLATTVLMDWRNLLDEAGKPIPFSQENALKLLADPDLTAFREAVAWAANVVADDAAADVEDTVKN